MGRFNTWATALRLEIGVLKLAATDPHVPKRAKWLAAWQSATRSRRSISFPDFIPVIGHFDDLVIVPGLAWLALRQIDPALLAELREKARRRAGKN